MEKFGISKREIRNVKIVGYRSGLNNKAWISIEINC